MEYLVGLDLGTSSVKISLIDETGHVILSETENYPLNQPRNGWAEQNPDEWWNASVKCFRKLISDNDVNVNNIAAIGLTGQMHGLVLIDADNEVMRPAIIWADQRSVKECDEITEKVGFNTLIEITANPALAGFTASKLLWVKNNEPDIFNRISNVLLPKDFIRFKLTGALATDASDASGTQLLNIQTRSWSPEIMKTLGFDPKWFPEVYESPEVTSGVSREAAIECRLRVGIPVIAGAGDNAASAVGTGVTSDGKAFLTIGTSGVVFAHSSKMLQDVKGRIHTFCAAVPNEWHVMGVTQAAGLSLSWFRDELALFYKEKAHSEGKNSYYYLDKAVLGVPIGSDRLIYLPYLMGERTPHLDANARGVFFGLSAVHTTSHMFRSILEGVAFSQRDSFEIVKSLGIKLENIVLTGGGQSFPWNQIICDILNCPAVILKSSQGASVGAALLAGVGCGMFQNVQSASSLAVDIETILIPESSSSVKYEEYYEVYKSLYPVLKEEFAKLHSL